MAINSALHASCAMPLFSLFDGHALRGGIDVGLAVQLKDKEIYGPALERAYSLESDIAQFPRIVVGSELLNYLQAVQSDSPATPTGELARKLAKRSQDLIVDDAGQPVLDYLGSAFYEVARSVIPITIFDRASEFINAEAVGWKAEGNVKLAERYERLKAYFNAREEIWRDCRDR